MIAQFLGKLKKLPEDNGQAFECDINIRENILIISVEIKSKLSVEKTGTKNAFLNKKMNKIDLDCIWKLNETISNHIIEGWVPYILWGSISNSIA